MDRLFAVFLLATASIAQVYPFQDRIYQSQPLSEAHRPGPAVSTYYFSRGRLSSNAEASRPLTSPYFQPGSVVHESSFGYKQPSYVNAQPQYVHARPSSINDQSPDVQYKTSFVNAQPSFVNAQPLYLDAQPPTMNDQLPVVKDKPSFGNPQLTFVNYQPSLIETAQPSFVNPQPQLISTQPSLLSSRPSFVNGQPPIEYSQLFVNSFPLSDIEEPAYLESQQ